MAKKVLTPEQQEIKAMKKAKKSQNRTKFWAIVLALVLTLGIAFAGKSQGEKNKPETQTVNSNDSNNNDSFNSNDDSNTPGSSDDDSNTPASDDGNSNSDTPASNDGNSNASSDKMDEAAVAAAINKATGEAVKAKVGYDWKRDCEVKDINVGNAIVTKGLDGIIKAIDKNATLNSVVGGFLGNGNKQETIKKGETLGTMKNADGDPYYHGKNYELKATSLKASDIKNLKIDGDKFSFELPDCQNPHKNGDTALSRFTNDIVVREDVEEELKGKTDQVSIPTLNANYSKIKVSVTIKDGKLVEIAYSYYGEAQLDVKIAITAKGTGNLTTSAVYSNFKY